MSAQVEDGAGGLPSFTSAGESSPFGVQRIWRQVQWDLFATKDVQDAITASYVWLEDEAGHISLGFISTITLCWIVSLFWSDANFDRKAVFTVVAIAVTSLFAYKEFDDRRKCSERWGRVFKFDSWDLDWNVETAILAFLVGVALAVTALVFGLRGVVSTLVVALVVTLPIAYWWLKHKVAFQQAGLPYLFRLANFDATLDSDSIELIGRFAGYRNKRVSLLNVLFGRDSGPAKEPEFRHILITGDLGAGKTSLCVGIGTEFAFSLKKCRYLTAVKLIELLAEDGTHKSGADGVEFVNGLNLWTLDKCDMVIVDDVDVGVSKTRGDAERLSTHLISSDGLRDRLTQVRSPLGWMRGRRSVWVIGDAAHQDAWRTVVADLLGLPPRDIGIVHVHGRPAP